MSQSNPKWRLPGGALLLLVGLCCGCVGTRWQTYRGHAKLEELRMQANQGLRVNARECSLTLVGDFRELHLDGDDNFISVRGSVERIFCEGKSNKVECSVAPTSIQLRGQGQRVLLPANARSKPPKVDVQGQDQAVQFQASSEPN